MLENFKNIQKVEVSPYLFTRIEQGIQNRKANQITSKTAWATLAMLSLLLLLNLAVINFGSGKQNTDYQSTFTNSIYE